jgi:2-keto-3-deoxy-L-rhamnonate aldolase RhmA
LFKNRVKGILREGKATLGAWVNFGTPDSAEIMAHMGLDWLVFDTEHGPWSVETVQDMLRATSGTEVVPIVRVPWNDPVMIKRALDIGAYGVVVPWINTKEEAIKAVSGAKYPPKGIRGCGPRRAALYGLKRNEYLEVANELVMVIAQIETREAVENLDDILSVDGIDVIFIGPADLASSHGLLGKPRDPKNLETMDRILDTGKKFGVPVGIYSLGPDYVKRDIERGFQFVVLGSDMSFLIHGLREILKKSGRLLEG